MKIQTKTKLDYLAETKALMKSALIEKGQTVADNDTFRSYADKIRSIQGGGETEKDIFPKDTVAFSAYPQMTSLYYALLGGTADAFTFTAGETYYVKLDGKIYSTVAREATLPTTGETGVGIGNFALVGAGEDTGEPFGCAGNLMLTTYTDSTHTVRIYQKVSGGSADDRVKYVTYMDRGAELIKYPVIEGDTARDPVAKGYIEKPTKEPTESTVYTQSGWSKTDGGAPDSTALQNVTEDRTVYAAFTESARKYTVNFYDGDTLVHTEQIAYRGSSSYEYDGEKEGYFFGGWSPVPENITGDMDCYVQWSEVIGSLNSTSWAKISEISEEGTAANYWAVGDTKSIEVKGTVGTLVVDDTYNVYIMGFDHNKTYEGTGITFGTFKTLNGVDVALCDSKYGVAESAGKKYFNMSHWGISTTGGWAGCDLRYDILGSTDVAPSGYGAIPVDGRTGYDATETCATTPVPNTLMAALPVDLRAVMKPMTKYTNNKGWRAEATDITATIDYLPLVGFYEIYSAKNNASSYEDSKQAHYAYWSSNSKIKYNHSSPTTAIKWLGRSPYYNNGSSFMGYAENGLEPAAGIAQYPYGLAPIFKV